MKKRLIRITTLIMIVSILGYQSGGISRFFKSPTAEAVGDLSVDWGTGLSEGDPIFVVTNMAPGDTESRTVTVNNASSATRPVGVRGMLTTESANLSGALSITISENSINLYGGNSPTGPKTLSEFFADSAGVNGIFLSDLAGGASTQYTFDVTFDPGSGNEFQAASVIFDLQIGISIPTPDECTNLNLDGDLILGTENRDILRGTKNGDLIIAFENNDIVLGSAGDDCIIGGSGLDNLHGETGSDVILGQEDDDVLLGHAGNDSLFGGNGRDSIHGHEGNDNVDGEIGDDSLHGANGNDTMIGGEGRDAMYGDNGSDTMNGGAGNDSLHGGNHNDIIDGGPGTNTIFGGRGVDTCSNGTQLGCER